jgi:outer membrane immunogenic protein
MKNLLFVGSLLAVVTAGPAVAADLPATYKAPPPAVFNWSGCYLGGQIGGQWGSWTAGVNYTNPSSASREFDTKATFIGGGQIGCNYQPVGTAFVIGFEGDFVGAKSTFEGEVYRYTTVPTDHFDAGGKIGNQGSLRVRLGAAYDRWMMYAAGGVTWATIETNHLLVRDGVGRFVFEGSATRPAWNIGVGVEYAFVGGWTAGLEYRYTKYSSFDYLVAAGTAPFVFATHTVTADNVQTNDIRFRLNYLFGGAVVVPRH